MILYQKLYINVVSIIVLNIEARQNNIKIILGPTPSAVYTVEGGWTCAPGAGRRESPLHSSRTGMQIHKFMSE